MISFLINRNNKPSLQPILDTLGKFNPQYLKTAGVEIITLTIEGGKLDMIILFNTHSNKVSCQVITVTSQRQFAYYEYEGIVDKKDMLDWWFSTCRNMNDMVLAARAIQLAFLGG